MVDSRKAWLVFGISIVILLISFLIICPRLGKRCLGRGELIDLYMSFGLLNKKY